MEKTCSVDGCERPARTRKADLCNAHYFRVWRTGKAGAPEVWDRKRKPCEVQGCDRLAKCLGYCDLHYQRLRSHGDVTIVLPNARTGPANPNWLGDRVGYNGAHNRVEHAKGGAANYQCVSCSAAAKHWAYDHQDPNELSDPRYGPYSPDPAHYQPMCVPCHKRMDLDHIARVKGEGARAVGEQLLLVG